MKWLSRFSVRMFGVLLFLAALIVAFVGFLNQHYGLLRIKLFEDLIADFYANLSTEFMGIALTVLVIDQLYERSRTRQLKEQLIRQMGSPDNGLALLAVEELRAHGWLEDGSLRGVSFYQANLDEALLHLADLEQSDFTRAKMRKADLKWANFQDAKLKHARLEDSILIGTDLSKSNLFQANLGGTYLIDADLQEVDLQEALLTNACLWGANLRGAKVTEEQLCKAVMLCSTIMPDGSIYDGRFNLKGDALLANEKRVVDDVSLVREHLPEVVQKNETHARQYLRWKWVLENLMDN